jgi:phage terminase large subunit
MSTDVEIEAWKHYRENPYDFVVWILGVTPNEQQAEVLRSLPKSKRIAIRSGNGVGKTALESWIILWFMYSFPNCRIPCTAPTNHQLNDVLWSEIKKWLNQSKLGDMIEWTATELHNKHFPDTWFAVARASSEPTNFQGFHEENILFVIDEASGVADEIWEAVRGSLTTQNAYCLICGNPNYLEGFFYKAFHQNADMWRTFHFSSLDSSNVTRDFIDEIVRDFGIDSNVYRVRVLGEFPLEEGVNLYLPMTLIKYAIKDKETIWEDTPHADFEYDMGLDPAREGSDEAVFVISKHNTRYVEHKTIEIVNGVGYQKSDGQFLIEQTNNRYQMWGFYHIYIDETGMGGFLYDVMRKQSQMPVVPVTFNKLFDPKSPIKDNNKEVMYKNLKSLFERQRKQCLDKEKGLIPQTIPDIFVIPNIPRLVTQLASLRYEFIGEKLSVHHEDGGHDDWCDSLALSLFRYAKNRSKSSYSIS